jgi:hypothetical protein
VLSGHDERGGGGQRHRGARAQCSAAAEEACATLRDARLRHSSAEAPYVRAGRHARRARRCWQTERGLRCASIREGHFEIDAPALARQQLCSMRALMACLVRVSVARVSCSRARSCGSCARATMPLLCAARSRRRLDLERVDAEGDERVLSLVRVLEGDAVGVRAAQLGAAELVERNGVPARMHARAAAAARRAKLTMREMRMRGAWSSSVRALCVAVGAARLVRVAELRLVVTVQLACAHTPSTRAHAMQV